MKGLKLLQVLSVFLIFVSCSVSQPVPGDGEVIFEHDFSNGMPEEFQASASYPDSGTWGRAHDLDGGGVYDPASIDNGRLRMVGPSCSYRGTAYPAALGSDTQNWEISYRVDARPGSTGHGDRLTGGIRAGVEPQGNYNDDIDQLVEGRSGFWDYGSTYRVRGWDSEGDVVSRSVSTNIGDIRNGKWNVRVATSKEEVKTWVKYWQEGNAEPEDWTHEFENTYLKGTPGFEAIGTCKGNSRSNYYDYYELREIGLEGDFCNRRGLENECIMDEENSVTSSTVNISEPFISLENATIDSEGTVFDINNKASISGLWKGKITIEAERTVIKAGARFRPLNRIKIGR